MDEAERFVMNGGEVTMAGGLGGGWYKVKVGSSDLAKQYVINLHDEYDETNEEEEEEEDDDDKKTLKTSKLRGWWQVIQFPITALISELKHAIASSTAASPRAVDPLQASDIQLLYAGKLLESCKFHDEKHDKEEGLDVALERTLVSVLSACYV
jgi:hypothetical protein